MINYLIRICHFKLPSVSGPGEEMLTRLIREKLQDELPQLDRSRGGDGRSDPVGVGDASR